MIKKIFRNHLIQNLLGWLISSYIKICYQTSTWYIKNDDTVIKMLKSKKNFIVCFWHNRLLMAPFCWQYHENKFKMLISGHADGRIISNAVSHFGIETISGSSNKKKISSAKEILIEIKKKSVIGITPDGPNGPKEKIKPGLISLIKKTAIPIIPLSYSAKFKINLSSWDNFIFPPPFNKFVAVWGKPISFNKKKNSKNNLETIEHELKRVSLLSDNLSQ